mgnify:CR=1 FL=1
MVYSVFFFFQAEDGIRDLVRSRGLGDVYKRQAPPPDQNQDFPGGRFGWLWSQGTRREELGNPTAPCLLYTSDAADERSSVDLGGRRIIKKKKTSTHTADKNKSSQDQY